ncbi:MAG TPA: tyrosine-type recombinase/integrase, partial [Candidatus Binatia bacterium]|nr:tyrosine-type recombinase/integrase [Candidatus Binatia bacterium]
RIDSDGSGETLQRWVARWFSLKNGKASLAKDRWNATRLLSFFGEGPLAEITTARVEDYKLARAGEEDRYGRLPKPATINRELALLRSILRMAHEQDALLKLPKVKLYLEHNERHRTATREEFGRLLKVLSRRQEVCDILEILWEQGLRENEVVGLRWPQVDLEREVFVFPPLSKKEKKPHEPPMSPRTVEILSRRAAEASTGGNGEGGSGYVFTTAKGSPLKPRWFKRLVSQAMKKAGIQGLWVHDLRGSFITRKVIDEGYDRKLVKVVTGHATDYAFERYLRPTTEQAREMLREGKRYANATRERGGELRGDNS